MKGDGGDEAAIRFLEGKGQPLREAAQEAGHDPARRADSRILQGARSGYGDSLPDIDQLVPSGMREGEEASRSQVENGQLGVSGFLHNVPHLGHDEEGNRLDPAGSQPIEQSLPKVE